MDDEIGGLVGAVQRYLRATQNTADAYAWEQHLEARERMVQALAELKRSAKVRKDWA